ncbi:peroxidase 47-like [Dorcoceras hygrometricum]|uniref:Peroxidase 47-like n=1 Tax=Dorcoceras hygrometricum TaxID=472368 RepID=A0A2Z7CTR2_9LAMI|nr:peroxidase 47-like [Dorcoceras hygrometricum]
MSTRVNAIGIGAGSDFRGFDLRYFEAVELKEIAMQHRAQRVLAGLTIVAPEASFVGLASDQSQVLSLESSSRAKQEQAAAQEPIQQIVQQDHENKAVNSQEHQARKNEPPVQAEEPQALDHEHQAHDEPKALMINSKMHSMESKICSINSNIEQPMDTRTSLKLDFGRYKNIFYEKVDKLAANVTTYQTVLETSLIRHLAVQQYQLTTDLDMVKLQLAELVEHLKRIGDAKKGEGGQSRPVDGSSRQGGEGPSGGQSTTRGRGPIPRGGRGPSPGIYRRGEDSERFKYSKWF